MPRKREFSYFGTTRTLIELHSYGSAASSTMASTPTVPASTTPSTSESSMTATLTGASSGSTEPPTYTIAKAQTSTAAASSLSSIASATMDSFVSGVQGWLVVGAAIEYIVPSLRTADLSAGYAIAFLKSASMIGPGAGVQSNRTFCLTHR
nr:hypothetical protein CFP56_23999 [Quercus suber]